MDTSIDISILFISIRLILGINMLNYETNFKTKIYIKRS